METRTVKLISKAWRTGLALMLAPVLACGGAEPTQGMAESNLQGKLVPVKNGEIRGYPNFFKCLDVFAFMTENGSRPVMWDCNGLGNQQWSIRANGEIRGWGNKCLDVFAFGTQNGTPAVMWDCNGLDNQQWTITPAGEIRGWGNKCLDVFAFRTQNGAAVLMWDCDGLDNQKWRTP